MERKKTPKERKKGKTLKPITPSAVIERQYRHKIRNLIDDMTHSVFWWTKSAYKTHDIEKINKELEKQKKKWYEDFSSVALMLATWFALKNYNRTSRLISSGISGAGFTPLTSPTPVKDIVSITSLPSNSLVRSIVAENVSLIKSIPEKYLTEVEGIVQRGFQNGHDLGYVTKELYQRYEITERRAKMIARDQTNKATQTLARTLYIENGITEAYWMHTAVGKTYRKSHVAMDGMRYKLAEGLHDNDPKVQRKIQTGELINCHCQFIAILPDLEK